MIIINDTDYTRFAVLPIKTQYARDESLNQGVLTLKNTSVELPFKPMSVVIYDGERWLVGSDNVTKTRFGNRSKYQHDIILIEETKLLEKYFVDNCTFTNSLAEAGTAEQADVFPQINAIASNPSFILNDYGTVGYFTPAQIGSSFTAKKFSEILNFTAPFGGSARGTVQVFKDGNKVFEKTISAPIYDYDADRYTTTLQQGKYEIIYSLTYYYTGIGVTTKEEQYSISYKFEAIDQTETIREPYTITDVINRLLYLTEIQRKGNYPRFTLNEEQSVKYSLVNAPEMSISNCTLREALNKVGDFIHCQVRLVDHTIYFDEYTTNEIVGVMKKPVAESSSQEIEQFCTEIESNVQNLVPDQEDQAGSVIDPYLNGYITPRAETGTAEINDNTAIIPTKWAIHKLIKLEMGYLSNNTQIGDITEWVDEKSIYDLYSSYTDGDINSKSLHIYWEQGKKGIKGLTFETQSALHQVFSKNAITNIINAKLGTSYSDSNISVPNMQFRITYIPVISARLKQVKTNIGVTSKRAINAYNQSAYKISGRQYGENMKGVVARLGNIEKVKTYIYKKGETLPQIANKVDEDYTISVIRKEEQSKYYKVSLGLSKNFNRQNQFVGINNEQRFYEISEKNAVERYVLYEDFAILSNSEIALETDEKDKSLVTKEMVYDVCEMMNGHPSLSKEIYSARLEITNKAESQAGIEKYINLPVISYNFGNSACYSFDFENNYGAGNYVAGTSGQIKLQNELRYSDITGEFEFMGVDIYSDRYYNLPTYYSRAVASGDLLPKEWVLDPNIDNDRLPLVSTNQYPIRIQKDNREVIHFSYQIHCVSYEDNVVVGSSLARALCVAGWDSTSKLKAYILNRRIGAFENYLTDLSGITPVNANPSTNNYYETQKTIVFPTITANAGGKSVAIVKDDDKSLVFGINMDIVSGQNIDLPDLYFRHKLYAD